MKKSIKKVGRNFKFSSDSYIMNPKNIEIGNDVFINRNFYCSIAKSLKIKDRVMFGANCSIIGGDHKYDDPKENMRFTSALGDNREIVIEEDAWIGHGTVILKKACIGEGTIIGSNCLVNSTLKPYSVYAGQPAKFIKPRFRTYEDLQLYLQTMKTKFGFASRYSEDELKGLFKN